MKVENLYSAFPEIFDFKNIPEELLANSEILPFFFELGDNPTVVNINIGRPVVVFPNPITNPMPKKVNETEGGEIPMLVFQGKVLGLYLPFHFYYKPNTPAEDQIWGIWIVERFFGWFLDYLKEVECSDKHKTLLTQVYIVSFALFYHKIEIFVTSNEVFERELHYKHHFNVLKKDLITFIDKYAHNYACNKILNSSAAAGIPFNVRRDIKREFCKLFEVENEEELRQENLLNELFNKMHQPGKWKDEKIWVDIKNWFDSKININSQDNLFLVKEINPL
jgi:hypothetical protein